jgi:hypothetical protein
MEKLEQLLYDAVTLIMNDMSHKLCLIRRADIRQIRVDFRITPITPHIQSKLAIALRNLDSNDHIRLYQAFGNAAGSMLRIKRQSSLCRNGC